MRKPRTADPRRAPSAHHASLRITEVAFQMLARPAYDPSLTGTLVSHRAFWDHDAVGLRAPSG